MGRPKMGQPRLSRYGEAPPRSGVHYAINKSVLCKLCSFLPTWRHSATQRYFLKAAVLTSHRREYTGARQRNGGIYSFFIMRKYVTPSTGLARSGI
jgi:hypothetical protein